MTKAEYSSCTIPNFVGLHHQTAVQFGWEFLDRVACRLCGG